jgi:hypothetical protein
MFINTTINSLYVRGGLQNNRHPSQYTVGNVHKAFGNKVNLFVSSVLFVFWYHSPNFLDTPRIYTRKFTGLGTGCIIFILFSKKCCLLHNVICSSWAVFILLNFVHCQIELFWVIEWLSIALCKGSTRLGVSFSEDKSRAIFQNIIFFLNWIMDKEKKKCQWVIHCRQSAVLLKYFFLFK